MNVIKRLISKFGGRAEKPALPNYKLPADSTLARYYDIADVAKNLSEKRPFFRMNRGVYAVEKRKVTKKDENGKLITVEEPTNFIRVSKKRGLVGKARKKARIADRLLVKESMKTKAQREVEANG